MNVLKSIYCILVLAIVTACVRKSNDIDAFFPEGSKLNIYTFKDARQIIRYKNDVILVYDISTDWDQLALHLLVYDSTRMLRSARHLPAYRIDSVRNDTLFAEIDPDRRKSGYRDAKDRVYHVVLTDPGKTVNESIGNKLVYRHVINASDNQVTFYFKTALDDIRMGLHSPEKLDAFTKPDSIVCDLNDLWLNLERNQMAIVSRRPGNIVRHDYLSYQSKEIYDDFYTNLWRIIQERQ